jgi:hypothetical protein
MVLLGIIVVAVDAVDILVVRKNLKNYEPSTIHV